MTYLIIGAALGAIAGTAVVVSASLVRDAQDRAARLQAELDHAQRELANTRAMNSAALVALDGCRMELSHARSARPAIVLNGQTFVDAYYTQGMHSLN